MTLSEPQFIAVMSTLIFAGLSAGGLLLIAPGDPIRLSLADMTYGGFVQMGLIDENKVVLEDEETGEELLVVKDISYIYTVLGTSAGMGYIFALATVKARKRRVAAS